MALFTAIGIAGTLGVASTSFIAIGAAAGLNTLVGIGLNKLAMKLSGADAGDTGFGVTGQMQRGADIPQSFLFGKSATAGSLEYVNTWTGDADTPNAFYSMVVSLSDLPIQSLDAVWVNGERGTIAAIPHALFGHPIEEFHKDGSDHVWVHFYDGTQTTACDMLVDDVSTTERPWESTAVGEGTAYAVVTFKVNRDLFTGFPPPLFECEGVKLYDPSKDTTVGGSGSHRWDTPSTWGGDGDHLPAVQLYNLLRGLRYGSDWVYGMQVTTEAQLPAAHWIAQINKCRAEILGDDGNEPTYRSGGEIPVGTPVVDAVNALLDACQGRLSEAGGVYKLFVGAPDAAVATFTDGDILSTEEQRFTPFFGLSDTVNGISAKYPDPAQGWQTETAPPLNNTTFETQDGARRLMVDVEFDLVPYPEQVQRLMLSALNEARRARRHTFTLPPRFWTLEPGDVVSWTSARNGYDTKLFRVDGLMDQPNGNVVVDLTEVDPDDYDFDTAADFTPVAPGSVSGGTVPAQEVLGWAVSPTAIPNGDDTDTLPAILAEWTGDVPDVAAVRVQVRRDPSADIIFDGNLLDVASGEGVISTGILAATDYEARAKYIPGTPRDTAWTSWRPVTTYNLGIGSGANDTPKAPTYLTATGYFQQVKLTWTDTTQNTDDTPFTDLQQYNIYRHSSDDFSSATFVGASPGSGFTDTGLEDNTTYWYWVTAQDISGNVSVESDGDDGTTNFITAEQMVDNIRTEIGAVRIDVVATLPADGTGYAAGDMVLVTADGKLYEWDGSLPWNPVVGEVPDASIVADMIASGAVTGDKLPTGVITETKIGSNAVTTSKIIANAVTATKIATDAVTANKILAGSVTADKIATNAITADKINANAITSGKISTGAVSADKIAVGTLAAINANLGSVTAGSINTLSSGAGMQINVSGKANSAYIYQYSAETYGLYCENSWIAGLTGEGGAAYFKSEDGFTVEIRQISNAIGNRALFLQNDAGNSVCEFGLSPLDGSHAAVFSNSSHQTVVVDQTGAGTGRAAIQAENSTGGLAQIGLSSSDGGYAFNASDGGYYDSSGDGYGPFTGVHFGFLKKGASPEPGDILCDKRAIITTVSDSITELSICDEVGQRSAVGVMNSYSNSWNMLPALHDKRKTLDEYKAKRARGKDAKRGKGDDAVDRTINRSFTQKPTKFKRKYNLIKINSVGEGGVNVCGRGGDIEVGDLIVTSDIAGKGQRQKDDIIRSSSVAKAREAVKFTSSDEIKLIACIYLCG